MGLAVKGCRVFREGAVVTVGATVDSTSWRQVSVGANGRQWAVSECQGSATGA